jgi:hypothetical protein
MLVIVILDPDREADRGITLLQEGHLIPTPPHAVGAPDLAHLHFIRVLFRQTRDPARQIARGRVVLAAEAGCRRAQAIGEIGAWAFGKDTHHLGLAIAILAAGIADDVVVEHRLDGEALCLGPVGEDASAEQALLLARKQGVDDGAWIFRTAERPCRFEHQRRARTVIIRARRIAGEVERIGHAAVDMPLHDHDFIRALGAALDGDRVAHQRGRGDPATVGLDHLAHRQDFKAIAAAFTDAFEFAERPIHRRADAAPRIVLRRKRVTRAEADQRFDVGLQAFLRNVVRRMVLGGERGSNDGGEQGEALDHALSLPRLPRGCKPSRRARSGCARPLVRP